jgi:dipeptidyl aminopeptidase/acylaminoacyl peptidase
MRVIRLVFILFLIITAAAGQAQTVINNNDRLLTSEVLWDLKRLGPPVISPDGRWVVAPVTRYTKNDDKSHTDLWLFAADGSIERQLTMSGFADGQPVFSPDGSKLAFVSRRNQDDASQIYLLPIREPGEAVRLTEIPTGVSSPKWAGNHIYFISRVWPKKNWEEMSEKIKKEKENHISARTWSELPYAHWDSWIDEQRQAHLYRIPASGGEAEPITLPTGWELPRSTQGPSTYDVARDGSYVAFSADSKRNVVAPDIDIFLVRPGSSEAVNITPASEAPDVNPLFSPDSRHLAFNRQKIIGFYADTRRLYLHDIKTGIQRSVAGDWDRSTDGLVWLPDGTGMYGEIDDAGTKRIYHINIATGAPRSITAETDFSNLAVSGNGTLIAVNQSFLHPPQLVVVNPRTGQTRRIDTINDDILTGITLGTYESVTYTGYNGKNIQMWVHYPPGFDKKRQYPLFLLIHGGPHSAITDGFHFRWNAQTFASWGYVVAWPNFHGSSGFGQDFTDAINPDWITKPYEDVLNAAEWFARQPWIDDTRMVAGGGSYGGYLSSILLGRKHPFKSLVIHAPVYNLYSQMAGDFPVHSARFGDFWEDPAIYKELSPHYYADNFNTPALVIHGQLDYRVPVGQAFELFRTLQHRRVDSRLIYYPDENHWILKPNNSIYWYSQVREWIEKYAAPETGNSKGTF